MAVSLLADHVNIKDSIYKEPLNKTNKAVLQRDCRYQEEQEQASL